MAQPATVTDRGRYTEHGISGTQFLAGRPFNIEERSTFRTGDTWASTAREMARTDPAIRGARRLTFDTILTASIKVEAGPGAEGERNAELIREAFGLEGRRRQMAESFESFLATALLYLDNGWRYLEPVYRLEGDRVWVDRIADRDPTAHCAWVRDDGGRLSGVAQQVVNNGTVRLFGPRVTGPVIPADKLLLFVSGQTGENYEGDGGILRACVFPWELKRHAGNQAGIGVERWANPTPVVVVDERAARDQGYTEAQVQEMVEAAKSAAMRYVSKEDAWLLGNPAVRFETFGSGSFDPGGVIALMEWCDAQMLLGFLVQFMKLGVSGDGSRAVGQVHQEAFRQATANHLDRLLDVLNGPARPGGGLIARLIDFNFGGADARDLPRLTHEGIAVEPLADALGVLPNLVAAGVVRPNDALEDRIRMTIGAPPLPDEDRMPSGERAGNVGRDRQTQMPGDDVQGGRPEGS